ncbi:MAG: hypothetical protein NW703_08055 [Nitrospiraceae bacterium]
MLQQKPTLPPPARQGNRLQETAIYRPILHALAMAAALCFGTVPAFGLQILELRGPYSFVVDPDTKEYFISSINGDEDARDNNGFITKVDESGKVVALKFIEGGRDGVTLHAPRGLAIVGQTLYVADLDQVRGFDKSTGKLLLTFPLGSGSLPQAGYSSLLMDIAYDGKDLLYVSDRTGQSIFRIDVPHQHQVSTLVRDPQLGGPAGLAVHPKGDRLVVVSWDKGNIVEVRLDGTITELISNGFFSSRFGNLSGVDFDRWGSMYISDFTRGKIWRMASNRKLQVIAEYLPSPADIAIDRTNHVILVPYHYGDAAEVNGLESPVKSGDTRRTLADYGFTGPPKDSPPKEVPSK